MITTTNLLIVLLVPLVVAFVLFKFLNTRATIKGKTVSTGIFKDIQFDLGGAFAAYVIVAGGILYFSSWQARQDNEQVWIVKGTLRFATQNKNLSLVNTSLALEPSYKVLDDGTFDLSIIRDSREVFPKLRIVHAAHNPKIVHIEDGLNTKIIVDNERRIISIKDTIVLEPVH